MDVLKLMNSLATYVSNTKYNISSRTHYICIYNIIFYNKVMIKMCVCVFFVCTII